MRQTGRWTIPSCRRCRPSTPWHLPSRTLPGISVLQRVAVSQTNFEAAPVSVMAEISSVGFTGARLVLELLDESGQSLERQVLTGMGDDRPISHRFQFRPEKPGVSFYQVRAIPEAETQAWENPQSSSEATLANNSRWLTVDRGAGPYRVLYVTGRPNWEFKFLRRGAAEDEEIRVVGLVRIAKREPKFTFRGNRGESTNPLYRGFGNQQDEQAEQYDEPVLIRLGTEDEQELRDGFPKDAETLFRYHAIVLDDLEAGFFTQDQMSLIQQFVSQRGGGLLMLGGQESFTGGAYDHSPIGEMLPVYIGRAAEPVEGDVFRLRLTRDGWLQPWVRLRATEADEQLRLAAMPELRVLNSASGLKPGATSWRKSSHAAARLSPHWLLSDLAGGRPAPCCSVISGAGTCAALRAVPATWKRPGDRHCAGWSATCRRESKSTFGPPTMKRPEPWNWPSPRGIPPISRWTMPRS